MRSGERVTRIFLSLLIPHPSLLIPQHLPLIEYDVQIESIQGEVMRLLGAHMSIAGGYYKAVEAAAAVGMNTVQLFTKNNNQWNGKPIGDEDVRLFRDALETHGVERPLSHSSYLLNLGSPDDALWERSIAALVVELERADALGVWGVVLHPGAHVGSTEEEGLDRVAKGLDETHKRARKARSQVLLETTAGQGTCLGWRFEQIAAILERTRTAERLGICLDTCHVFAAGYPLAPKAAYQRTFEEFGRIVGLERLRAIHLNDSKKPFGSRVDRHEHIGEGELGLEPFRLMLNDPRLRDVPMYLETPKGTDDEGRDWDAVNLATLRGLIKRRGVRSEG